MNKIDKYIIKQKLDIITKLQEAYVLLLNDGDITKFCDENNLNFNMLLDLLAIDWSITLNSSLSESSLKVRLNSPIEKLNLSTRTYNALKRANIHVVHQVLGLSLNDLNHIKNLGNKGVTEVITQMQSYGINNRVKDIEAQ